MNAPAFSRSNDFKARIARLGLTGAEVLAVNSVAAHRNSATDVSILCPFHAETNASFSVRLDSGAGHCFSCNEAVGDIVGLHRALGGFASMGAALVDLESRSGLPVPSLTILKAVAHEACGSSAHEGVRVQTHEWIYRHADGTPAIGVNRYQWRLPDGTWFIDPKKGKVAKDIRPFDPCDGRHGIPAEFQRPGSRPLLNLPAILAAPPGTDVLLVEGEMCVDAAMTAGWLATTSHGGANAWRMTDWSPLAGRDVLIFPDNDPPGEEYAQNVKSLLLHFDPPAVVRLVDTAALGLPPGGDFVDFILNRGGSQ